MGYSCGAFVETVAVAMTHAHRLCTLKIDIVMWKGSGAVDRGRRGFRRELGWRYGEFCGWELVGLGRLLQLGVVRRWRKGRGIECAVGIMRLLRLVWGEAVSFV